MRADPLKVIPAGVPGVVVFPDLARAVEHWNLLVREVHPDADGLSVEDFTADAFPEQKMWDPAGAVAFVLARPECRWRSLVVVFKPADAGRILKNVGGRKGRINRCDGPNGRYYLMIQDDVGFISERRRSIRTVALSNRPSLAKSLDRRELEMYRRGDVFARFSLSQFRASVQRYVGVALAMARFGMASGGVQNESSAQVVDAMFQWITERFRSLVLQLETIAVSVDVTDERYCLSHHLRFAPDGAVAGALSRVRSEEHALLESLPDRPFFVMGGANWKSPVGDSITVALTEDVFDHIAEGMSRGDREKLIKEVRGCYGQMSGSTFLVGPSGSGGLPLWLVGGYFVQCAETAVEQFCFMQENAGETMGALLTGSSFFGVFEDRTAGGVSFKDMPFDPAKMREPVRQQTVAMYGANPRYQVAAGGPSEVVYYMGSSLDGICGYLSERKAGTTLDRNRDVSRMVAWLPENPNIVVVIDLGTVIGSLPSLMALAEDQVDEKEGGPARIGTGAAPMAAKGLLIGWGVKVGDGTLSGQVAVARNDIEKAIQLVRKTKYRDAAASE